MRIIAVLVAAAFFLGACGDAEETATQLSPSPAEEDPPAEEDAEPPAEEDPAPAGEAAPGEEPEPEPAEPHEPETDGAERPPIVIESPAEGERVAPGALTASGVSVTYEATVHLRLIDPNGDVIEETFTTASQPALDEHGPWEHTFAEEVTPGEWAIEAEEPDPSEGEGSKPYVTRVEFEVR